MTTLHTERLTLRPWCLDDFEPLAAFLADGDANRFRGAGRGLSRHEAWNHFCATVGQWTLRGYGEFAVAERDTGTLVGWAGLWHPVILDEPELAWSLFAAAQGRGYATEAADRVMRWAARDLALAPLFSFVHPDNTASRRVAERLGATLEDETEFRGQPRLRYRHRDLATQTINRNDQPEREHLCQS